MCRTRSFASLRVLRKRQLQQGYNQLVHDIHAGPWGWSGQQWTTSMRSQPKNTEQKGRKRTDMNQKSQEKQKDQKNQKKRKDTDKNTKNHKQKRTDTGPAGRPAGWGGVINHSPRLILILNFWFYKIKSISGLCFGIEVVKNCEVAYEFYTSVIRRRLRPPCKYAIPLRLFDNFNSKQKTLDTLDLAKIESI